MFNFAQGVLSYLGVPNDSGPSQDSRRQGTSTAEVGRDSTMLLTTPITIETLRARVASFLRVFDDPRYAHLDVPDWMHRATSHHDASEDHHDFTVRNLIRAMCDTAATLDLAEGERYLLTTVCACAENSQARGRGMNLPEKDGELEALAGGLQYLANAWVAFLLWPFYARMEETSGCTAKMYASPCTGLALAPKAMAYGDFDPYECMLESSYPLRDQLDGWSEDNLPPDGIPGLGFVDVVRIFKHPLVVYKEIYDSDEAKRESIQLSMNVLHQYCQLSEKYVQGMGSGVMDDPENLVSLDPTVHGKFDMFALIFIPTKTPNVYQVKDLDPRLIGMPFSYMKLPRTVTFRKHGYPRVVDVEGQQASPVGELHNPDLLRMHAALGSVLYTSGVVNIFGRILGPLDWERLDELPIPDPDGMSFWRDLVDSEGLDLNHLARLLGVNSHCSDSGVASPLASDRLRE